VSKEGKKKKKKAKRGAREHILNPNRLIRKEGAQELVRMKFKSFWGGLGLTSGSKKQKTGYFSQWARTAENLPQTKGQGGGQMGSI